MIARRLSMMTRERKLEASKWWESFVKHFPKLLATHEIHTKIKCKIAHFEQVGYSTKKLEAVQDFQLLTVDDGKNSRWDVGNKKRIMMLSKRVSNLRSCSRCLSALFPEAADAAEDPPVVEGASI